MPLDGPGWAGNQPCPGVHKPEVLLAGVFAHRLLSVVEDRDQLIDHVNVDFANVSLAIIFGHGHRIAERHLNKANRVKPDVAPPKTVTLVTRPCPSDRWAAAQKSFGRLAHTRLYCSYLVAKMSRRLLAARSIHCAFA